MRSKSLKLFLLSVCAVFMVALSVVMFTAKSSAAAEPALNKTSRKILIGKTYNLNINNKISGSKYVWTTSDKKIATVNNRGIVTAKKKGEVTITCTITTKDKKQYVLDCKVTVIKPAAFFRIKNKVSALNLGQTYDFDRIILSKSSNDKTTWTTSDPTIANPDKLGVVTALKEGTVTITGTTLSGKSDSVTFKVVDKDGIVTTQEELNELLGTGVGKITIKTDEKVSFRIPRGSNEQTNLVIDAPNAEVTNLSKFKSVEIKQIAENTYYDYAIGNNIVVSGKQVRIVVGVNAKVRIEAAGENTKIVVENDGVIEEVVLAKGTELEITGSSKEPVPVVVTEPDCKISSNVPLDVTASVKTELTLLEGAEGTKVQVETEDAIPVIKGNLTVEVTIGTGEDAETKPVTGNPVPSYPIPGGSGGGPVTPPVSSITINAILNDISAISITTINDNTYTMDGLLLTLLKNVVNNNTIWKLIENESVTEQGKTISVTGTAGSTTKTLSISGGTFDGKSYTIDVSDSGVVTITSAGGRTVTISKSSDGKSLTITGVQDALNFPVAGDALSLVKGFGLTYKSKNYSFNLLEMLVLKTLLTNSEITEFRAEPWKNITNRTWTVDNQVIKVSGVAGSSTKIVTFENGQFAGNYTVTLTDEVLTVKDNNNVTASIALDTNKVTLSFN
jgi:uncharacterized protein YjdB